MTKEDAIKEVEKDYPYKAFEFINQIFYDFESRTCMNCEYFTRIGSCDSKESVLYDRITIDDFGCNKFERKINGNI